MYINENEVLNPHMIAAIDRIREELIDRYGIEVDYQEFVKDSLRMFIGMIHCEGFGFYLNILEMKEQLGV